MAQTIQILRTTTNTPPSTLLAGALSAELGTFTKLWLGSAGGNRLLLSSDPADSPLGGSAYLKLAGGTLTGPLVLAANPSLPLGATTKQYVDGAITTAIAAVPIANATAPTRQVLTTGSGTYTTPANVKWIEVICQGGGGGGASSGTGSVNGQVGGATTFGSSFITASGGGGGGPGGGGGTGGAATGGDFNFAGGAGQVGGLNPAGSNTYGGAGGVSCLGGAAQAGASAIGGAWTPVPNTGSGGTGAYGSGAVITSGGGGAGGYCCRIIGNPAATYAYAIGGGGAGGTPGSGGAPGGAGAAGIIIVTEHYNF